MTCANGLQLRTNGVGPGAGVFTLIGTRSIPPFPIPGTPCAVDLMPLAVLPGVAIEPGIATREIAVPRGRAADVLFQQVLLPVSPFVPPMMSTGVVRLVCP